MLLTKYRLTTTTKIEAQTLKFWQTHSVPPSKPLTSWVKLFDPITKFVCLFLVFEGWRITFPESIKDEALNRYPKFDIIQ